MFAERVNNFLAGVSNDLSPLQPHCEVDMEYVDESSYDFSINLLEVFNSLSRINVHKSPGPDGIPNWFLGDFAFAVTEPVCHIFNSSLRSGSVPELWKIANAVPVPKSSHLTQYNTIYAPSL